MSWTVILKLRAPTAVRNLALDACPTAEARSEIARSFAAAWY